jgi:hypothetical protein
MVLLCALAGCTAQATIRMACEGDKVKCQLDIERAAETVY